ncbi:hypothetical protein HMPREF9148_01824 [Prevotella sp. F0091]|jgi:hypothetical protein|nr:hypothetical protein HMPREF9148_01824 [Prevotella sp. F0091]
MRFKAEPKLDKNIIKGNDYEKDSTNPHRIAHGIWRINKRNEL